jgi:hypothetical protein
MALDRRDEVVLRVAIRRGLVEMRVGGDETLRRAMQVGEVAAPAARDQDFRAALSRWSSSSTFAPRCPAVSAHQPGRAGAITMASNASLTPRTRPPGRRVD